VEGTLADWVRRAQQKDAAAFAMLIRACERTALAVAFAVVGDGNTAGDVTQEAFLRAWQRLGDLHEPERFEPWLCGIVRNLAIDHRRRARPMSDLAVEPAQAAPPQGPADELDRREQRQQVAAALEALDDLSRSAVVLRYYEGLPSKTIARLLDVSPAAIDMRLSRARQELKRRLAPSIDAGAPVRSG
jgi:RNA polymerase sigma factor (sigma-70 family)